PVLEPPHPVRRHLGPGEPGVVLEREARFLLQPGHLRDDLLTRERGHRGPRAGIDAHGDGAAGEEDVDMPARHLPPDSPCALTTTTARAASTTAPPASVHTLGTSWNRR